MGSKPDITASDLTLGEKARIAILIGRMANKGRKGKSIERLKGKVVRIERRAEKRKNGE